MNITKNPNAGQSVRFMNATDEDNLDFYMFNTLEFAKSCPGSMSNPIKCGHGTITFKVCKSGQKETYSSSFVDFYPGSSYTICAVGKENEISMYAIPDIIEVENPDYSYIRLCMLSRKNEYADLYANQKCVISRAKPMDVSRYVAFVPGTYDFEIKKSDSEDVCASLNASHLEVGNFYSLFVTEKENTQKLNHIAFVKY